MITLIVLYFIDKKHDLSLNSFNLIFLMGFLELLIESAAILSATELIDLFETQHQLIKTLDKVALPQYWARVLMKGDI